MIISIILFCLKMLFIGSVPPYMSALAYQHAVEEGVDPDWVGAMLITEHRGAYPTDSVSSAGCVGLYQLWTGWASNKYIGTSYSRKDLFDWRINTEVAVKAIRYMVEKHEEKCKGRDHTWVAHYKCTSKAYDHCRPEKRARRVYKHLRRWNFDDGISLVAQRIYRPIRLVVPIGDAVERGEQHRLTTAVLWAVGKSVYVFHGVLFFLRGVTCCMM